MSLVNGSIPLGATYAPTGGTAKTIKSLDNGPGYFKGFIDDSPATSLERKLLFFNFTEAKPSTAAPDGYTKQRSRFEFQLPEEVLTDVWTVNKLIVQSEISPLSGATMKALIRELLCHLGDDADFDDAFNTGSNA
jgi:hypothetical protein